MTEHEIRPRDPASRAFTLPSGARMPLIGQGTWHMAEGRAGRATEIAALRAGLDAGTRMIDTAEMYADGGAEELVGEAVAGRRDEVFLVSKVFPFNASYDDAQRACERSLKRLGTDWIDLYLLHWPGGVPYAETLAAFRDLKAAGKILDYGVSNFDRDELQAWCAEDADGGTAVNQVYYSLGQRGIETDLLPWCQDRGLPVMAYAPFDQGRLPAHAELRRLAEGAGLEPAVLALAWLLSRELVSAIPKTGDPERAARYARAPEVTLSRDTLAELDALFPAPSGRKRLAIL